MIAEAVKFFHLNAISSPILVKVAFDVALTMVADTLYTMLAAKLRGSEASKRVTRRSCSAISLMGREWYPFEAPR